MSRKDGWKKRKKNILSKEAFTKDEIESLYDATGGLYKNRGIRKLRENRRKRVTELQKMKRLSYEDALIETLNYLEAHPEEQILDVHSSIADAFHYHKKVARK